jgi:hypothetical protein
MKHFIARFRSMPFTTAFFGISPLLSIGSYWKVCQPGGKSESNTAMI